MISNTPEIVLEGFWHAKLDAKLRLTLPASLISQIPETEERTFFITKGYGKNFILRPKSIWNKFYEENIRPLSYNDPTDRTLRQKYTYALTEVQADKNWRITLPKRFCDQLSITKDITIQGFGELLEIWDQDTHDQSMNEITPEEISNLEREVLEKKKHSQASNDPIH